MVENTRKFTDAEIAAFAERIQKKQTGPLPSFKNPSKCIASALCRIGSMRNTLICGDYANKICERLKKIVGLLFSEQQKEQIISYCMDDTAAKTVDFAITHLGAGTVETLERLVPVFMSRAKKLTTF